MRTLSGWFKALSEDIRLQILALIFRHGELCGCELERFLNASQSTVSRHLRYLLNAGLVEDSREGLWVYYRLARPADGKQRRFLETLRVLLADIPSRDVERDLAKMRAARCGPRGVRAGT